MTPWLSATDDLAKHLMLTCSPFAKVAEPPHHSNRSNEHLGSVSARPQEGDPRRRATGDPTVHALVGLHVARGKQHARMQVRVGLGGDDGVLAPGGSPSYGGPVRIDLWRRS